MVVTHNFQDLFDSSLKVTVVSLPSLKENPLKIEFENSDGNKTVYHGSEPVLPFANSEVFFANIAEWRRLTAIDEGCKDVYEVTFDITGSNFQFSPGDTIGIIPHNSATDVDIVLGQIDLKAKADVSYKLSVDKTVKGAKILPHVPVRSTLRYVLMHCLDLRSVVKKLFILALSKHTKDESERKILEYICSKEGSSAYTTYVLNKNICILDIFAIFKSCKPPIEVLFAHLPRLLPRPYSIANSQLKDPNILKICFSVMTIDNNRKGLTTGWLEQVILDTNSSLENRIKSLSINKSCENVDDKIPIYMRKNLSGFSMQDIETPLLLIGPGTGVAPYICYLQEREILKQKAPDKKLGEVWLFYGCRNPKLDFIYERELLEFTQKGVLNKLFTAFSRTEGCETKYIQDSILQNGEEVTNFIKNGATIFLCGDLKTMTLQIKDVLVQCLVKHDGKSLVEAEQYITELQKNKKYLVDMWS